jgi:hypothetical protein
MSLVVPPTSTSEAVEMLTSAMSYLANADPVQMVIKEQARCLATLEKVDAAYSPGPGSSSRPESPKAPRPGISPGSAEPVPTPAWWPPWLPGRCPSPGPDSVRVDLQAPGGLSRQGR